MNPSATVGFPTPRRDPLMHRRMFAVASVAAVTITASAADWSRFRGPNGTGVVEGSVPTAFDMTKDVAWKVKLPGVGHGSPIVVGEKVILPTAAKDGDKRSLVCLSAKTGDTLWTYTVGGKLAATHKKNNLASGTACSDGERVYAAFWDGAGVTVRAVTLDGKEVWKEDLGSFKSQHGVGHSPMVVGGLVILNFDQDGAAELIAFDAKTGDRKWTQKRVGHRACYSTPFLNEPSGKPAELIVATTTTIDSYDPKTGNVNWSHTVDWANPNKKLRSIGQPILAGGKVVMSTGDGDGSRYMLAVDPNGGKPTRTWEWKKNVPYVPGLLTYKGHLYWIGDDGTARCADAKTGQEKWAEQVLFSSAVSSSPILVGDTVMAIAEDGKVAAFAASPDGPGEWKKSNVGEPVFATPAAANGKLYIRGGDHLFCIQKKGS
jgi:outer membrane protein assembly factor BamB